VVKGNSETGLGHVYRTTLLAQDLVDYEILFVTLRGHDMAAENIRNHNFPVIRQGDDDLVDTVLSLDPQVVINDILATDKKYIEDLKSKAIVVVNFEDLGSGADIADLVINAIYEEKDIAANHLNGPMYFCLRDEFFQTNPTSFRDEVEEVLVTFGGTDANNLVKRVVGLIIPIVADRGIRLSIVTGPGYIHLQELKDFLDSQPQKGVELANGTKRISDYMARADIAFSSAGRTVFELANMLIPSVIIASHEREELHTFASEINGMKYIGRHDMISDQEIVHAFMELLDCTETRHNLYKRTKSVDVKNGRERVISALMRVIEEV